MDEKQILISRLAAYINSLMDDALHPDIPQEFAQCPQLLACHEKMLTIRKALAALATGDLTSAIPGDGFIADACKTFQAHLRHICWKALQISNGNYQQRAETFGEVAESFNGITEVIHKLTRQLYTKEEALLNLSKAFQEEVKRNTEKRVAIVKELKQSETAFKYQAEHDPLTEIFNRRSFFAVVRPHVKSHRNLHKECCIALLDIDFFKTFNDTYGHAVGDEAIRHIVKYSSMCLRQSDCMARYGGEEFIFFFPETDLRQGKLAVERIRSSIAAHPFMLEGKNPVHVTVSIGICAVPLQGKIQQVNDDVLQYTINQADKALYAAKRNGRNRVEAII